MKTNKLRELAIQQAKEVCFITEKTSFKTNNLIFLDNITNEYELGYHIASILKKRFNNQLYDLLNFEALGYYVAKNQDGLFTDYGYLFFTKSNDPI